MRKCEMLNHQVTKGTKMHQENRSFSLVKLGVLGVLVVKGFMYV